MCPVAFDPALLAGADRPAAGAPTEAESGSRGNDSRGLAELERWLLRASREVDALAARAAPRCVARTEHSDPIAGLSFEQEIRIAASLHDLSAALASAARMAGPAASALNFTGRQ